MADPRAIIDRIRALGGNVVTDRGKLIVINREKLPAKAIEFVRENAREIAAYLDREADFEERAAIIQYDGGLTRATAEYLTRLLMSSPPDGTERADWSWFVGKAAEIIDAHAPRKAA
jgi:hypothetical protein